MSEELNLPVGALLLTEDQAFGHINPAPQGLPEGATLLTEDQATEKLLGTLPPRVDPNKFDSLIRSIDIYGRDQFPEKEAKRVANLFYSMKLDLDPNSQNGKSEHNARTFLGLEADQELPSYVDQVKSIRELYDPNPSNPEMQAYKEVADIESRIKAGEDVPEVEIEWGVLTHAANLFSERAPKKSEDAWTHHFRKSRLAQRELGEQIMSKGAQEFALKTLITKDFDETTFKTLNENDKQYFFTYLKSLSPKQDKAFFDEVGLRVKRAGYDSFDAFVETGRMFHEGLTGAEDPVVLYRNTKNMSRKEAEAWIKNNIEHVQRFQHVPLSKAGAVHQGTSSGFADNESNIQEATSKSVKNILENYDDLMAEGKATIESRNATKNFYASIRPEFKEKGMVRNSFMTAVDMSVDLGAIIAVSIPTGGYGGAVYTMGRYAGPMRQRLIDEGVSDVEANRAALTSSVPYVVAEMIKLKSLAKLAGVGTKGTTKLTSEKAKETFLKGLTEHLKKQSTKEAWQNNIKEFAKGTYTQVSQEAYQSLVEQATLAYAKEYLGADDIAYRELDESFRAEIKAALSGMPWIVGSGMAIGKAGSVKSKTNYNLIEAQKAMLEHIKSSDTNIDYSDVKNRMDEASTAKMWKDIAEAETDKQIAGTLSMYGESMSVGQAKATLKNIEKIEKESVLKAEALRVQMNKELDNVDRTVDFGTIKEVIGNDSTIEQSSDTSYKVTGKGGASFNINIMSDLDFNEQYEGNLGIWDASTKSIVLPESATDVTLSHEFTHALEDLGVISKSELETLTKMARKADPDSGKSDSEAIADFQQEIQQTGDLPPAVNSIIDKIKAWLQDALYVVTKGKVKRSARSISKDITSGKILKQSPTDVNKEGIRPSKGENISGSRLASINVAKDIIRGNKLDKDLDPEIVKEGRAIAKVAQREIAKAKRSDDIVNKAIRKAEITRHFNNKITEVYREGFNTGVVVERAAAEAKQKEQTKKFETPFAIKSLGKKTVEGIQKEIDEGTEIDIDQLFDRIQEEVHQTLIDKKILEPKQAFKSNEAYKQSLKEVTEEVIKAMMRNVAPGMSKEKLKNQIREFRTSKQTASIISRAKKLVESVNDARSKQSSDQIMKEFNKTLKKWLGAKLSNRIVKVKTNKNKDGIEEIKEIDPITHDFLRLAKQVSKLSGVKRAKVLKEVQSLIENTDGNVTIDKIEETIEAYSEELTALKSHFLHKDQKTADPKDRLIMFHKALSEFGAIKSQDLQGRIRALEALQATVNGSITDLAKKRAQHRLEANSLVSDLEPGIRGGKKSSDMMNKITSATGITYSLKSLFRAATLNSKGETQKKADKVFDKLLRMINRGVHERDVQIDVNNAKAYKAIEEIYGKKPFKVLADLAKPKKEYDKYSKQGRKLSKLHLMQIIGTIEQDAYKDNQVIQDRAKDLDSMKSELTAQDLEFMEWFKDFYQDGIQRISDKSHKVLGVRIQETPEFLPTAIKTKKHGLPNALTTTNIIPASLKPRVDHQNDLNEEFHIFDLFLRRNRQNEHFMANVETMQMLDSVLGKPDMHDAIEGALGAKGKEYLYGGVQDWINDGYIDHGRIPFIDKLRSWFTWQKFAFNARIGIKQLTSIPAFAHEIGVANTVKYTANAITTSEGREAMLTILKDPLAKNRMNLGNTEELQFAIERFEVSKLRNVLKHALWANRWGDIIPSLIVGQGIYRSKMEELTQTMSKEDAHKEAISQVFEVIQSTQQSSSLKDQGVAQRRGGSLGQVASIFTNTTRQFLERELVAAQRLATDPTDRTKQADFGRAMFVNHVALPALYNGMNIIINAILGDSPDEDDWRMMFISMVVGPASGFIIGGAIAVGMIEALFTGKKGRSKGFTPLTGIIDDASYLGEMASNLFSGEFEDAGDDAMKIIKSQLAPVREALKAKENFIDK